MAIEPSALYRQLVIPFGAETIPDASPIGCCLYCGANDADTKLSREHIIPDGIGGILVLPRASCERCAKEINQFEQDVTKTFFGMTRIANGIAAQNKKRRKGYRSKQNFFLYERFLEKDEAINPREPGVPENELADKFLEYFTDAITVPDFMTPPGILHGEKPDFAFPFRFKLVGHSERKDGKVSVRMKVDLGNFERQLAKIAHGFAAYSIGLEEFKAFLPAMITNRDRTPNRYLIGSMPVEPHRSLHRLSLYPVQIMALVPPMLVGQSKVLVVCDLHLFCHINPICYQVVVGELG